MNSSSISITNIPNFHQDVIRNKSIMIICNSANTHKTTFKLVTKSSFKVDKESITSGDEKASTRSNFSKEIFTSLTSSFSPLVSNISNLVSSYSVAIGTNIVYPKLHRSVDPKHVLTGNFAPVGETAPTECSVEEGEIPSSLKGAYIRNGPNPQYMPIGPYHLWSGDGMLHSIHLSDGRAIFCSRYVKTCKYELEQAKGHPIIPNVISGIYSLINLYEYFIDLGTIILEGVPIIEAFGVANTSLAFFHDNLFALADGGRPYRIQLTHEGDLETLREYKFSNKAPININAHPKVDTETKDVFAFQLHIKYPYLTFFRCGPSDSDWKKVPILSMKRLCFVHDFAITKQYAIFFDTQLEVSLSNLLKCKGIPIDYQASKVSRIGILPRYAMSDSEMKWVEAPCLNAFHIVNSWEEGDQIVIITPTVSSPDNILYELGEKHSSLEKIIINTKTDDLSRKVLSKERLEFGSINPLYQGKKTRYAYMAISGSPLKVSGMMKIDLELECEVASIYYEPDCFGGEALFVPRCDDLKCDEDDGFLVSYMHNETTNESHFVVMDAKLLDIVCKVKLPGRVPYGLHGLFLNEEQVKSF